ITAPIEAADVTPPTEPVAETANGAEVREAGEQPPQPEGSPSPQLCPFCQAPRRGEEVYCQECGWIFPPPAAAPGASVPPARLRLQERYELGEMLGERGGVTRYRGLDHGASDNGPLPVIILQSALPPPGEAVAAADAATPSDPNQPGETLPQAEAVALQSVWPRIAWERAPPGKLQHPGFPGLGRAFVDEGFG